MRNIEASKIVIKVGTSTLTFDNGSLNLKRIEELVRVISDIKNSGRSVILVTSGAIGVGVSWLRLSERPTAVEGKQATAAVGQCQLMGIYGKLFGEYNHVVGQILLTKDVVTNEKMRQNAVNTFDRLLKYNAVPIVNENDTISTDEILFGDNDTLSAHVANITNADLLILLTDVDGLWDENKVIIKQVNKIDDDIKKLAGGAGSKRGTGGMITKILAAEIAADSGTKTVIINGGKPDLIHDVLGGFEVGTFFNC